MVRAKCMMCLFATYGSKSWTLTKASVNSGGLYRGEKREMFQMLYFHISFDQHVVLSILTPLSNKSVKKWRGAGQKTDFDEGASAGGLKMLICVIYKNCMHISLISGSYVCV